MVSLTEDEKEFHKNEVLRFMATHEPKVKSILSPFDFNLFPKAKFAVAGIAFLMFFTTGLFSSAKSYELLHSNVFHRVVSASYEVPRELPA